MKEKPVIGAAMMSERICDNAEWLIEGHRDLEIQDPCNPALFDNGWKETASLINRQLSEHKGRRGVHAPFIGYSFMAGIDSLLTDAIQKRLFQCLEFCSAIGGDHMVVHSPFLSFGSSPFASGFATDKNSREKAFCDRVLEPVLKKAEENKCLIVMENIHDTNPIPLLDFVKSFESKYLKVSLDVGHCQITHHRGGPSPDLWVRHTGDLLAHMHIQDSDGLTDRHWMPGEGMINWYALFESIYTLHEAPRMVLELRDPAKLQSGADFLIAKGFVE